MPTNEDDLEFEMPPRFPCTKCPDGEVLFKAGPCSKCVDAEELERERKSKVARCVETIPVTMRWASFDGPELAARVKDPKAFRIARAIPSFTTVILHGASGVGKTSLATAMFRREVARLGKLGVFVDAFELSVCRSDAKLGVQPEVESRALRAGVLLLDDLGSERDVPQSPITDVLHQRHAAGRPTIVTTWMNTAQIIKKYGEGVGRRLFESGRSVVINLVATPVAVAS